jgi:hypothetical protein
MDIGPILKAGGAVGGASAAVVVGPGPSVAALLTAAVVTLFVNIVVPASRALGRGLELWIERRMDPGRG